MHRSLIDSTLRSVSLDKITDDRLAKHARKKSTARTKGFSLDYSDACQILLSKLQGLCHFIYVMGSVGTPRFHSQSDIDVAVYWIELPELETRSKIMNELEDTLGRPIDLVSLNNIDIVYARQVLKTGRLIYANPNEKGLLLNWKAQKMSEYPDFKYSRKSIEDNVLTRKKYV